MAADVRACVAYARSEYRPTSLGLMGFCYGGGKALEEAAAGNALYTPRELSVRCVFLGVNYLTVCWHRIVAHYVLLSSGYRVREVYMPDSGAR